ncbi:MAG: TolC family protein [Myxococcota bacterium]
MARNGDLGYKGRVPRRPGPLLLIIASLLPWRAVGLAQPSSEDDERAPVSDLRTLTRRAERTFPSVAATSRAIEAAREQLSEAKVSPFFQFEATAAFTVMPDARGTSAYSPDSELPLGNAWSPALRLAVEGALPLYTFGKLRAARKAARAEVDATVAERDQTLAELRYDVRRAYFGLQMALDLKQMISEGRPRLVHALERLEERLSEDDPDANNMDKWRLASALAEVNARASEADRLEATARAALGILTGLPRVRVPDCPLQPVAYETAPLERYVRRATEFRPETRMLQAATEAREADVQRHQARYFPDIGLALSAGYSYAPGVTDQNNPFVYDLVNRRTLGAALVARWSLDLWGNVHRVRRAEAQLAETEAQAHRASKGIDLEVRKTYETVLDARRREEAWAEGEREGRSWFVAAVQAYQVGSAEPRDLVDALKAYFMARYSHLEAIRELNEALAELERVSGRRLVPPDGWEEPCGE